MFRAIRRDARTIIIAVVAASLTAGAPAIAHGVHAAFAHKADKVDGKHAVGSGASLSKAKGKLVATGTNGKFAAKFLPSTSTLKPGQTLAGPYGLTGIAGTHAHTAISFYPRLKTDPPWDNAHFISDSEAITAECPGYRQAAPGHLCVYETFGLGTSTSEGFSYPYHGGIGVSRDGTILSIYFNSNGFSRGNWALTAP